MCKFFISQVHLHKQFQTWTLEKGCIYLLIEVAVNQQVLWGVVLNLCGLCG